MKRTVTVFSDVTGATTAFAYALRKLFTGLEREVGTRPKQRMIRPLDNDKFGSGNPLVQH